MTIYTNPDKILRQPSIEINPDELKNGSLQAFMADMALTMSKKDGVGLAAPQVGKNLRVIVVSYQDGVLTLANPKLIKKSWKKVWDEEGCLSVPKTFGQVKRHRRVRCEFFDKDGNKKTLDCEGLLARVVQHEIDHLDGILFIDKAKDIVEVD